jgi:arsenate reductase
MAKTAAIRFFHNPRCGKSRAALDLLRAAGQEPEVIEYLKTPPTKSELRELVHKLKIAPGELVRRGEEVFKANFAGKALDDEAWLEALAAHPVLIERPIAVRGARAVIGRPPERVLELL